MLSDDVLPQPFRFINQLVAECVDTAFEVIRAKEIAEAARRVWRPSTKLKLVNIGEAVEVHTTPDGAVAAAAAADIVVLAARHATDLERDATLPPAHTVSVTCTAPGAQWAATTGPITGPLTILAVSDDGTLLVGNGATGQCSVLSRRGSEYVRTVKIDVNRPVSSAIVSTNGCHVALVAGNEVIVLKCPVPANAAAQGAPSGGQSDTNSSVDESTLGRATTIFTAQCPALYLCGSSEKPAILAANTAAAAGPYPVIPQCHFVGSDEFACDEPLVRDHTLLVAWGGTTCVSTYALVNCSSCAEAAVAEAKKAVPASSQMEASFVAPKAAAGATAPPGKPAATAPAAAASIGTVAAPPLLSTVEPPFSGQRHRVAPHFICQSIVSRRAAGDIVVIGCMDAITLVWSVALRHFTHVFNDAPHRLEQMSVRPLVTSSLSVNETLRVLIVAVTMINATETDHSRILLYDLDSKTKLASLNYLMNLMWAQGLRRLPLLVFACMTPLSPAGASTQPRGPSLSRTASIVPSAGQTATLFVSELTRSVDGDVNLEPFGSCDAGIAFNLGQPPGQTSLFPAVGQHCEPTAALQRCEGLRNALKPLSETLMVLIGRDGATDAGGTRQSAYGIVGSEAYVRRWPALKRLATTPELLSDFVTVHPGDAARANESTVHAFSAALSRRSAGNNKSEVGSGPLGPSASGAVSRSTSQAPSTAAVKTVGSGSAGQQTGSLESRTPFAAAATVRAAIEAREASKSQRQKRVATLWAAWGGTAKRM